MSVFAQAGVAIAAAGAAVFAAARLRRLLHLFQLEHYENERLARLLRHQPEFLRPAAASAVSFAGVVGAVLLLTGERTAGAAVLLAVGLGAGIVSTVDWRIEEKKPFVFTPRARRLFGLALLPSAALLAGTIAAAVADRSSVAAALVLVAFVVLLLAPLVLVTANVLLQPVERRLNARFVASARARLAAVHPLVVGITGSYGKTTTKFCVGEVLARRYKTLVTPESYNSFLGVVRTINEQLEPDHAAFVVEMGAYRRGDIAELCALAKPRIGVITAVGPMHLERFRTIEAIAAAKAELLEALPADGRFVTNADDPLCREIAARSHVPVVYFGLQHPDATVRATGIRAEGGRTSFTLHLGPRDYEVTARLLGEHNVRNLLAAAACGVALELPDDDIVAGLEACRAPSHRLAPIINEQTGVTVIDDAYNANPEGAAGALRVLAEHSAERRVLVTPGMVELGELEAQENRRFGVNAAAVCDLVILVGGDRTRPIEEGLLEGGLRNEQIVVVRDITEATAVLSKSVRRGDVVLFENDLPDTYSSN